MVEGCSPREIIERDQENMKSSANLPKKMCPRCGRKYDFAYEICRYCLAYLEEYKGRR
jgi:predicted amidophosphoribosyltransferase